MRAVILLGLMLPGFISHSQWVKTNGPEGISIEVFYDYNNIVFAGTHAKGVYKSLDNGATWISSNTSLTENSWVLSMWSDDSYLFIGTLASGVYRSSDNGATWQAANNGIQNEAVKCMTTGGGYLFAGTILNGLRRSPDHGTTWENINQNLFDFSYIVSMVFQNGRLIVEADNYLFFSDDLGITWDIDQGVTAFWTIHHFFHHGDTLLAASGPGIFRSTDGGVNWTGPTILSDVTSGFDNVGETIYAGYKFGVFMSTDWGVTWTAVPSSGLRFGERGDNAFDISGNRFMIGSDEIGVYSSTDNGSSWSQCNLFNFTRASVSDDALIFHNGVVYAGTHSDGVYKTTNQGNNWTKIGTSNPFDSLSNGIIFSMLHLDGDIILAGACGYGLYRSADNGTTWTHITNGIPATAGINNYFACVNGLARSGPNVLLSMTEGVFYSTDNGLTWQATNLTGPNILDVNGFAVRNNIVCAGVAGNPSVDYTGIYRSTDYGVTWTRVSGNLDIITIAAGGNSTMYAGSFFTGSISHDDGLNWSTIPGIDGVFSILAWDNYAIIGNHSGIQMSLNNGLTWFLANEGFDPYPNNVVQGLTKDNQYVYAACDHDAIWRRPISNLIFSPLPVTIIGLKVEYRNGISELKWKTASEVNTNRFEIQRGFNGNDFSKIGVVNAAGNSSSIRSYMFNDSFPHNGMNFYRLKIVDGDGRSSYSNIVSVKVGSNEQSITAYPNPVTGKTLTVQLNNMPNGVYKIELYNAVGQVVYKNSISHSGGSLTQSFPLPGTISEGVYNLSISSEGSKYNQRLLISR